MILEDKFLKKIEEIKEDISKINDPLEMVRFLDEIQINTANRSDLIIAEETFCMDKSRCILVYFYTTLKQWLIM